MITDDSKRIKSNKINDTINQAFQTLEEEHKKLRKDFEEYVRLNPREKYNPNDNPNNSRPISF